MPVFRASRLECRGLTESPRAIGEFWCGVGFITLTLKPHFGAFSYQPRYRLAESL